MGHTICIASLKGGVGKSTTAVNLSVALALTGKKTLLIDCDAQGSATIGVGIDKRKLNRSLYHGLMGNAPLDELIRGTSLESFQVIPASVELFRAELELMPFPDRETILRSLLAGIRQNYDYIIMDTPPSLGLLAVNAINASDSLLIPLQCEFLAYESFIQLLKSIRYIKERYNPNLRLAGVLLTMYDMGENVSRRIAQSIQSHLKDMVFKTIIPRSVQLRESPGTGKPLVLQDPGSVGAQCYIELAREILERDKAMERPS